MPDAVHMSIAVSTTTNPYSLHNTSLWMLPSTTEVTYHLLNYLPPGPC